MTTPAVTRSAPSPTGDPHVGTAYVALFSWLAAKKTGGRYILRIEDTDRTRYDAGSEAQILEALYWLGLAHDEGPDVGGPNGPYRQSERTDLYRTHCDTLLEGGTAYRCFCTGERLEQMRKEQRERKGPGGYDGHCRGLGADEVAANLAQGTPFVVRLAVPKERTVRFHDALRGDIEIAGAEIDDQVLLKSDGFPTYHLANVVDDHLMDVNEVIRAEDWISSTPKHVLLYEAFGWTQPVWRHMPLLRNQDKSKISKRKNPTSLTWYKEQGYLPEALLNFLALMGYSQPDGEEVFTLEALLATYDPERLKTTGPVFDLEKLRWLNGETIRRETPEALTERLIAHFVYRQDRGLAPRDDHDADLYRWVAERGGCRSDEVRAFVLATIPLVQERLGTLDDYGPLTRCLFREDVSGYAAADLVPKKQDAEAVRAALGQITTRLDALDPWAAEPIEAALRELVETLGWKPRDVFQVVRVATTGSKVSPPLFETLALLGRERTLARLTQAAAVPAS